MCVFVCASVNHPLDNTIRFQHTHFAVLPKPRPGHTEKRVLCMERGSTHEPAGEAGGGRTGAPAARQRATSPATAAVFIKRHLYLVQDSIRTDRFNHQNWPENATVDIAWTSARRGRRLGRRRASHARRARDSKNSRLHLRVKSPPGCGRTFELGL